MNKFEKLKTDIFIKVSKDELTHTGLAFIRDS